MIYAFIAEHVEYPAARWAEFFGVSRSGYYAYKERLARREAEKGAYKAEIKRIFDESGGSYGPDRICGILRNQGKKASYRKVGRYMAEMGLSSVHNRHKTRSLTNSRKSRGDGFPNLVRGQTFNQPRQAVCSDITYLRSDEGWLYLCTVKDIVTKEILGETTSERMTKTLVIKAFLNAQARHNLAAGTIFHSDRGSQYTAKGFMATLELYGMRQSFSRVGMPGDNAWAESFFATLKKECVHFNHFNTRDELQAAVFAWINGFYNTRRVQAGLGYIPPSAYAALLLAKRMAA
ncbi:MAG: IS3 family transposase [Clostridiales bacterium]|nr:IS3 family transposase [Clostridiales bacterium]